MGRSSDPPLSARRQNLLGHHKHFTQGADRGIHAFVQLVARGLEGRLQQGNSRPDVPFLQSLKRRLGQGDRVFRVLQDERRQSSRGLFAIACHLLQEKFPREQTGAARIFFVEPGHLFFAGDVLFPLDHPIDFFELRHEVRAAKFDFLAGPAGASGVWVERHEAPSGVIAIGECGSATSRANGVGRCAR
jgi:hypothetical protein